MTPTTPLYEKLRPGPGRSHEQVAERQLARLRGAVVEAVASGGYRAATVRQVCALAGVSSRTFYEHFRDKEACLLDTHRQVVRGTVAGLRDAIEAGDDPRGRLRLAVEALLHGVAAGPAAARLALLEAPAAGPRLASEAHRAEAEMASLVERCFAGEHPSPPPLFAGAIAAGLVHVLRSRLLAGEESGLPALAGDLTSWAWACVSGAAAALAELGPPPHPVPGGPRSESDDLEAPIGDERSLLLAAATRLAADEGYGSLTAPRIRALAGVPRRSFDRHFVDLDDCFLTACAVVARRALADAARQAATTRPWAAGVERTLLVLFDRVAREPGQARLSLLDVMTPGREGLRVRAGLVADAAALLLTTVPEDRRPPAVAVEASVAAVWQAACEHVADDRLRQLHRLAPSLALLLAAPVQGIPAAARALQTNRHHTFSNYRLADGTLR